MAINDVSPAGLIGTTQANFDSIEATLGNGVLNVARFQFDTAIAANKATGAHGVGISIRANAVIVGGFYEVNTAFTSTNSTATIAISVVGANDIVTATAVSNAIYGTIGRKAIVPKANTPESTSIKVGSAAKEITCTVAVEALTAGKLNGYLYYVPGDATA